MASVTFTPTTTRFTYAIAPNGDAPLFRFNHTVFQGKAPRDYKIICLANVSVFETSAKVNVTICKANLFRIYGLPVFNELPTGTLFTGEEIDEGILTGSHVTQEQMSSLIKREGDKTNPLLFPAVREVGYSVNVDNGLEIAEENKKDLLQMIQKRMELQFPSITPKISEQEKKTP